MVKAIVLDCDGTLLTDDKKLSPKFDAMIEKCKSFNIKVIIATGRSMYVLKRDFFKYIDEFYFISENGSLVSHNENIISKSVLEDEVSRKIIKRVMNTDGIPVVSNGVKAFLPRKSNLEFVHEYIKSYYDYEIVDDLCEKAHGILKISAFVDTDSIHRVFLPCKDLDKICDVVESGDSWVDFNPIGVGKWSALSNLLNKLEISSDEVMAFGDSGNDMKVLSEVKYSIAMRNASSNIQSKCWKVTNFDNNHSGVEKFVLENLDMLMC